MKAQDRTGIERWLNEGGHPATEALIESERAVEEQGRTRRDRPLPSDRPLPQVPIVGGRSRRDGRRAR